MFLGVCEITSNTNFICLLITGLKQTCKVESLKIEPERLLEVTYSQALILHLRNEVLSIKVLARGEPSFPIIIWYYFSYPW